MGGRGGRGHRGAGAGPERGGGEGEDPEEEEARPPDHPHEEGQRGLVESVQDDSDTLESRIQMPGTSFKTTSTSGLHAPGRPTRKMYPVSWCCTGGCRHG